MSKSIDTVNANQAQKKGERAKDEDLSVWAHFADVGRTDKTTMVTVSSMLLGFSASIMGYIVTQLFPADSLEPSQPWKAICLALLGFVVSGVGFYVVVLYGGYSNWNWAKADEIALKHGWLDLVRKPNGASSEGQDAGTRKASYLARKAKEYSKPHDHKTELAPVFRAFAGLACLAAVAHLALMLWSLVYLVFRARR